jgi:transposase
VPIVGALDLHRSQITFKVVELDSGEMRRGRIVPAERDALRRWLSEFAGRDADFALEGTTGWRFVVEELERAGVRAHLAEPAETSARRGRKRRAKTDNADCDHLCELLLQRRLPASWIPPAHILELRTLVRLRKTLVDERTAWQERMQAQLYHQGVPRGIKCRTRAGRARLGEAELSAAGRTLVEAGVCMIDRLDAELAPLDRWLSAFARRQPGCRSLMSALFGVGPLISVCILAELGDCRRFSSSDDAVRHAGLDVTVYESDRKRAPGHLSHQGPALLRWALFEAAQCACRTRSPDRPYYLEVKARIDHNRACLSVARKLCRRAYHLLRELGDEALTPVDAGPQERPPVPIAA